MSARALIVAPTRGPPFGLGNLYLEFAWILIAGTPDLIVPAIPVHSDNNRTPCVPSIALWNTPETPLTCGFPRLLTLLVMSGSCLLLLPFTYGPVS